jgi:hypothetical protein
VIPPLSNAGATYAGPTQMNSTTYTRLTRTYVAPSNTELNATNYTGRTHPYVIPPLQEPMPASPRRAATTNGYNFGSPPAQPKVTEQYVSITYNLEFDYMYSTDIRSDIAFCTVDQFSFLATATTTIVYPSADEGAFKRQRSVFQTSGFKSAGNEPSPYC